MYCTCRGVGFDSSLRDHSAELCCACQESRYGDTSAEPPRAVQFRGCVLGIAVRAGDHPRSCLGPVCLKRPKKGPDVEEMGRVRPLDTSGATHDTSCSLMRIHPPCPGHRSRRYRALNIPSMTSAAALTSATTGSFDEHTATRIWTKSSTPRFFFVSVVSDPAADGAEADSRKPGTEIERRPAGDVGNGQWWVGKGCCIA